MISQDMEPSSKIYKIRHSLSHVLAQAMQEYRPGTKLGFGPPIENGFYYDFLLSEPIIADDLPKIEEIMVRIIKSKQPFQQEELPAEEALKRIEEMGEPHKLEYAKELIEEKGLTSLGFYTNGPFLDMCEGPHVDNTIQLPAQGFRLHSIASAYWRGDEKNATMTRVYAYAFEDKKKLKAYVAAREEALKNDHRKLGQEFDIYHIDDEVGKGLPLWLPNGAVLRNELEKLAHELEFKDGYQMVSTPNITKEDLYHTSGHLPYYTEGMYPPMILEETVTDPDGGEQKVVTEQYRLRPMNCPHHHKVFAARPRSYRDLPLRLAEYGSVYRFEQSGALQGLTRVRGMTMNDAHIYCTKEQIKDEFIRVMDLHRRVYDIFGFKDYYMRVSLRDPSNPKDKYVDNDEAWEFSQKLIVEAMADFGHEYTIEYGEAAFYGPKVDIQFRTVTGREFTVSTNQFDFAVPERFGLKYIGSDGEEHTPYAIHRAPLGTHERFIGFLIEHYKGAFPTWLAPVQVKIIPISEKFMGYADKLCDQLRGEMIRAEVDRSNETLNKKIRGNTVTRIPILLVVGENEETEGTVTVRRYKIKQQKNMPFENFREMVRAEIKERRHVQEWD